MPVGADRLRLFAIAEGIPAYGVDIVERDLPQETSQMRALHFNKGCYLGQEIVERIRSRGNVHRHLRQLELDGQLPTPDTDLYSTARAVGHDHQRRRIAVSCGNARRFALGMVRAEAETQQSAPDLRAGAGRRHARRLLSRPSGPLI